MGAQVFRDLCIKFDASHQIALMALNFK